LNWQTWEELPYLTCDLLADWQHGFFTRNFAPREPQEMTAVLAEGADTYRLKQVHGNTVLTPTEIQTTTETEAESGYALADGAMTETSGQAVWVASADCNPVLLANRHTGAVAAVHAGWRGTALKIVPRAVERLLAVGGTVDDIVVAIGPAIAGEVYQVTTQVGLEVCQTIAPSTTNLEISAILSLSNSPLLPDEHPGRVKLDVRRVNQRQLEQLGINPDRIAIAPHCTYQEPEYFFSYRREKLKKVQWSGIVS
jgi:YfiH family protein